MTVNSKRDEKGRFVKIYNSFILVRKVCESCKKRFIIKSNDMRYLFDKKTCSKSCRHILSSNSARKRIVNFPNTDTKKIGENTRFKIGQQGTWNGRKHSEESKHKMSLARSRIIVPKKDTKPEKMMQIWLALNQISFMKHKAIIINNRIFQTDIFIEPNICIEIDGDYWHANPKKYDPDYLIAGGRTAKSIWAEDIKRNHVFNMNGYQIIRIWESDIKNNIDGVSLPLLRLIKPFYKINN